MDSYKEDDEMLQFENRIDTQKTADLIAKIKEEWSKVIVGQNEMMEHLMIALLANGHVLLEGVPGVAKTLTAKILAKSIDTQFSRIQFTPDLMPSDITGTLMFNAKSTSFEFKKGPIFSNIVLIDEINRAPAKTQAALFEVMEERQITVDTQTYRFQPPFLVIATQNPIEQEGTYRLPEAQLDRFLFKISVGYPSLNEEINILTNEQTNESKSNLDAIQPVVSAGDILMMQEQSKQIKVDESLLSYIAQLVQATRNDPSLMLGASPRASIAILNASKARAILHGRDFVVPDDIKTVALPVLGHRMILTPEREMEGAKPQDIITSIIDTIKVPR